MSRKWKNKVEIPIFLCLTRSQMFAKICRKAANQNGCFTLQECAKEQECVENNVKIYMPSLVVIDALMFRDRCCNQYFRAIFLIFEIRSTYLGNAIQLQECNLNSQINLLF